LILVEKNKIQIGFFLWITLYLQKKF